jgi:hypothetical protein
MNRVPTILKTTAIASRSASLSACAGSGRSANGRPSLTAWFERLPKHVGIIQSLIVTCRLHGIDVYTYLVDVLQRVSIHPANDVIELTPRVWKTKFAHAPMKSDLAIADQ